MPTYTVTSPETGVDHVIDFNGEPTHQDLEEAAHQMDQPILSQRRLSHEKQMQEGLGGTLINPETGEADYSPEQQAQDQKNVQLKVLSDEQNQLQNEAAKQEEINKTGKLRSALAGAATVPLGVPALLEAAMNKAGARNVPLNGIAGETLQNEEAKGAVNPLSGAAGQILGNMAMIRGPGGTIKNVLAGNFAQAGKEAAFNVPLNMAIGQALRSGTGQPTDLKSLAADAAFGLLGGKEPTDTMASPGESGKIDVPGVGERTYKTTGQQVADILNPINAAKNIYNGIAGLKNKFSPESEFLRSVKYPSALGKQSPEQIGSMLQVVQDLGDTDIGGIQDHGEVFPKAVDAFHTSKDKVYGLMRQATDDPRALDVDVSPLIERANTSLRSSSIRKQPDKIAEALNDLEEFNRTMPMSEMQEEIEKGNAEFAPVWQMDPSARATWRMNNPAKAVRMDMFGWMRELRNDYLSKMGPGMENLGRVYGQLADAEGALIHRGVVTGRLQPIGLTKSLAYLGSAISAAHGHFGPAIMEGLAGNALSEINSSEAQLIRAFQKVKPGQSPYAGMTASAPEARPKANPSDLEYEIRQQYLKDQAFKEKMDAIKRGQPLTSGTINIRQTPGEGNYVQPEPPASPAAEVPVQPGNPPQVPGPAKISLSERPSESGDVVSVTYGKMGTVNAVKRGDKLRIVSADVSPEHQGRGIGTSLYKKLIDYAKENNLTLESDSTVETPAVKLWESLKKSGVNVEKHPQAAGIEGKMGLYTPGMEEPVFSIKPESSLSEKISNRLDPKLEEARSNALQELDRLAPVGSAKETAVTKKLREALSDVNPAIITQGIKGLNFVRMSAREKGGPISKDKPYLVGEKGPEIVVPKKSGLVLSNRILEAIKGKSKKMSV